MSRNVRHKMTSESLDFPNLMETLRSLHDPEQISRDGALCSINLPTPPDYRSYASYVCPLTLLALMLIFIVYYRIN